MASSATNVCEARVDDLPRRTGGWAQRIGAGEDVQEPRAASSPRRRIACRVLAAACGLRTAFSTGMRGCSASGGAGKPEKWDEEYLDLLRRSLADADG